MKVGKTAVWYNPWYAVVGNGNRSVKLGDIRFYDDNGVVCDTGRGWIEGLDGIDLPTDSIKLRRKVNFDGEVFVVTDPNTPCYEDTKNYILYIPAKMCGVKHVCDKLVNGIWQVYSVFEGDNGIHIERYIKSIDGKLRDIRNKYEHVHKECDDYRLYSDTDNMIAKLDELKELANAYKVEKDRLYSLTIDDIEL